jgi:hypothetical protein
MGKKLASRYKWQIKKKKKNDLKRMVKLEGGWGWVQGEQHNPH